LKNRNAANLPDSFENVSDPKLFQAAHFVTLTQMSLGPVDKNTIRAADCRRVNQRRSEAD
jgi:hypothetical protein